VRCRKIRSFIFVALAIIYSFCAPISVFAQASDARAHAREILDRARSALGGDAALKAIRSLSAIGDFRSGSGSTQISGDVRLDLLIPDKVIQVMKWRPTQEMKVTTTVAMNGSQIWTDSQEKDASPILGIGSMGGGRGGGTGRGAGRRSAGGGGGGASGNAGRGKHMDGVAPSSIDIGDKLQISSDKHDNKA
jgi:hypothetical protein